MKVRLVFVPPGGGEADYAMEFELPGVPQPGDYISVTRLNEVGTEDFIVRRSWWMLDYPHKGGVTISEPGKEAPVPTGVLKQLVIECEFALSGNSSDSHKQSCGMYQKRKGNVQEFENTAY